MISFRLLFIDNFIAISQQSDVALRLEMICSAARSYCSNKPRYEDKKSAEDDKDRPLDKRYIPIWKASRKSIILKYVLYVWLKDKKFNWICFYYFPC